MKGLTRKEKDGLLIMLEWIEFLDEEEMKEITGLTSTEALEALWKLKEYLNK